MSDISKKIEIRETVKSYLQEAQEIMLEVDPEDDPKNMSYGYETQTIARLEIAKMLQIEHGRKDQKP